MIDIILFAGRIVLVVLLYIFLFAVMKTGVGLVRGHNEDSFLLRTPLFMVSDGMGGHAAGEVASSIAVETVGEQAPGTADDVLLGAAVESAIAGKEVKKAIVVPGRLVNVVAK